MAIVSNVAVIIGVHVSLQIRVFIFSRYMLRSGIAGSYGCSIFSFIRTPVLLRDALLISCINLGECPVCVCVCVIGCSVMCNSLRPHGLSPTRLLCPWSFPGKNIRVGCHFLFQGILLTQGSNPRLLHLLHWQADSLPLENIQRIMLNGKISQSLEVIYCMILLV